MDIAKNFAKVTVTDGNYDASSTSIDLITGHGARLPAVPFNAVWWNATDYPDPADDPVVELVRVTDVTSDTLTITRAQEGTAAEDHNLAGKTYKMIAGITARTVNEDMLGDVHGSGAAVLVDNDSQAVRLRQSATRFILIGGGTQIQDTAEVAIGDSEAEGNFGQLVVSDSNGRVTFSNLNIATSQSASATGPVGTVVGKLPIYNEGGSLLGYLPIYNSIT